MEHSYEAYRTRAEELLRDTVCTVGLGAKRLTDAAKRQLEIADLHAEVNTCLRELEGEPVIHLLCPNCGSEVHEGDIYCRDCGEKL